MPYELRSLIEPSLVVNDVLGLTGHGASSAAGDRLFLVLVAAGNAVAALYLVLPFIVFPDGVNEARQP